MVHFRRPVCWPAALSVSAVAAGIIAVTFGHLVGRRMVRLREVEISVPDLPQAFDGYRIVQLSDFHVGGRGWSPAVMQQAADLAARQQANLIVHTGDFVETTSAIAAWTAIFGRLRAPDGVLAVLGNHDYADRGVRVDQVVAALGACGILLLRNDAVPIVKSGQHLWFVGVDDPHTGHDFLPRALRAVPAGASPAMLVHYPDFTWRLKPGDWSFALSGHAHGSQVRLPLLEKYLRERIARTRFSHGLYRINRIPVFVTTGVGTSGRPVRLFAPPEVAVIRLRAGSSYRA